MFEPFICPEVRVEVWELSEVSTDENRANLEHESCRIKRSVGLTPAKLLEPQGRIVAVLLLSAACVFFDGLGPEELPTWQVASRHNLRIRARW
mgnify:CR=1 FL=1